ncbi:MAG: NAD-dependent epimerase/dehydratase family protein [Bacteroidales bacterium]
MKKYFISGATGFIGSQLALYLAEKGNMVHALFRSEEKAKLLQHKNIKLFKGDILDLDSIQKAVKGCDGVFHVAAFAKVWVPDPSEIYHLNIDGAMNVINASLVAGVKKIVLTSTAGVLGSSDNSELDESAKADKLFIHYEHSKMILEKTVKTLCDSGANIVIVNPSRVYGPGNLSESNGVTRMINSYLEGKWRVIPGNGRSIGNYVFIDDVVKGHVLAMEKGVAGERYILGGENSDYNRFFEILADESGVKHRLFHLPLFVMLSFSWVLMLLARSFKVSPLIIPALVRKFNHNFPLSSRKAEKELGYKPLSLREGIKKTIEWLQKNEK